MSIFFRSLIKALLGILFLSSCQTQRFVKEGYFFGEVDKYFNPKEGVNVWVYRSFQPRDTGNTGLRTQSLFPLDTRMMAVAGLNKKGDKILFTVVPDNQPMYNMIAVKHKGRRFSTEGFEKKEYKKAEYFEKSYQAEGLAIRHVYFPYGRKGSLSLLYYALPIEQKGNPLDKFDYLAKINAFELQEEQKYNSIWQIFDCEIPERKDWVLEPRYDLLKKHKTVFLKIYDIYGANKTINFFKLMKKGDKGSLKIMLCPNQYVIEYYSEKNELLSKEDFKVE